MFLTIRENGNSFIGKILKNDIPVYLFSLEELLSIFSSVDKEIDSNRLTGTQLTINKSQLLKI